MGKIISKTFLDYKVIKSSSVTIWFLFQCIEGTEKKFNVNHFKAYIQNNSPVGYVHSKLRTICIAEISKPASRIAIRIFPSIPENTEQMGETSKAFNRFLEMQVFYIKLLCLHSI